MNNQKEKSNNQVIIIIIITMIISMVSGIHRFLISLLNNHLTTTSTSNLYVYIDQPAPLVLWLTLAFTIAPFGLTKAIADYYSGSLSNKRKILEISVLFYIGGVVLVILLLAYPINILAVLILPLASGFIGAGEGFFLASSQIILSNYTTGSTRGRYLGFSEFSIYGGYTLGSLTAGILSANLNFSLPYAYSLVLVFFTFIIIKKGLNRSSRDTEKEQDDLIHEKAIQKEIKEKTGKFKPRKLLRNTRILTVLIGSHFSKWGDALILLLPVYLAFLFSTSQSVIVPDTLKIGFLLGVYTASWAIGMFITSYVTELVGRKIPIVIGLAISGLGFLGLTMITKDMRSAYFLAGSTMLLAGIGTGLYYPLLPTLGLDIAKPKYRGQTLALFRTFRDFGYFTGPICLILLVYVSGSSIKSLSYAIIFTGLLMLLISGFFVLILRETRPIWPFFEEFVTQIILIKKVVVKSGETFENNLTMDYEKLNKIVIEAKLLEKKADRKKRQLYKEILVPMGRKDDVNDFMELVELTDKIGNHLAMASLKYSKLHAYLPNIPKPLLTALQELVKRLPTMMDELLETILLLNETAPLTIKHQKVISHIESEIDESFGKFLNLLYQFEPFYIETGKITIMMTLKEVSELLEQASDQILAIADNLSMIAMKHRL